MSDTILNGDDAMTVSLLRRAANAIVNESDLSDRVKGLERHLENRNSEVESQRKTNEDQRETIRLLRDQLWSIRVDHDKLNATHADLQRQHFAANEELSATQGVYAETLRERDSARESREAVYKELIETNGKLVEAEGKLARLAEVGLQIGLFVNGNKEPVTLPDPLKQVEWTAPTVTETHLNNELTVEGPAEAATLPADAPPAPSATPAASTPPDTVPEATSSQQTAAERQEPSVVDLDAPTDSTKGFSFNVGWST